MSQCKAGAADHWFRLPGIQSRLRANQAFCYWQGGHLRCIFCWRVHLESTLLSSWVQWGMQGFHLSHIWVDELSRCQGYHRGLHNCQGRSPMVPVSRQERCWTVPRGQFWLGRLGSMGFTGYSGEILPNRWSRHFCMCHHGCSWSWQLCSCASFGRRKTFWYAPFWYRCVLFVSNLNWCYIDITCIRKCTG